MSVELKNDLTNVEVTRSGDNWVWQEAVVNFVFDGEVYEARIRERHQINEWAYKADRKAYRAKGRLYIDTYYAGYGVENNKPLDEKFFGKLPEYTVRGDDVENDKAWDRYNRNWTKVSKTAAFKALAMVGVSFENAKFSKYAGCSCPCSSGWIIGDTNNMDLWVTIQPVGTHKAELEAKAIKESTKAMAIAGCY